MDRKAIARETLEILKRGYYTLEEREVWIEREHRRSIERSRLFTPEEGEELLSRSRKDGGGGTLPLPGKGARLEVKNSSTVDAVLEMTGKGECNIGVLNFASAKNPGGGFLNGAMAQEESLAASSGLYHTLTRHEEYYRANRAQRSMIYTDHAIDSPDVVFFRDGRFRLLRKPVLASVLTLPAVNMGQVLQKGEDKEEAERAMRRRMALSLALFAEQGSRNLVLGAYGCGVFRNDPAQIAAWWRELLETDFSASFEHVLFAVLDQSKNQACIRAFETLFS